MTKIKSWKELNRKLAYKKYSRKIEEVVFELPDGTQADFYIKTEGPAVCIFALTTNNQVILVRQFRVGPKKILDELPGGYLDQGSSPMENAKRELKEETGYEGDLKLIGTCLDDAYSTMERYCFVAKNCTKVSEPASSATEQTEVVLVDLTEFRKQLRAGQKTDIEVGYLALDSLGLL